MSKTAWAVLMFLGIPIAVLNLSFFAWMGYGLFQETKIRGEKMKFDVIHFVKTLCCTGGLLSLADYFWFAYEGSNLDFSLPFLSAVVAGAAVGSIFFKREG